VQLEQWGVEGWRPRSSACGLECAQCHKHPTDRWTQADYRSFANLFAQVILRGGVAGWSRRSLTGSNAERRAKNDGKNANRVNVIREMYLGLGRHPRSARATPPRPSRVKALTDPENVAGP